MKTVLILFFAISCSLAKPLLTESYGQRFTRHQLSNGEWETVEKAVVYDGNIWVYSKADRKIVRYTESGEYVTEILLPSIGRSNYLGDDFAVKGTAIYFVNSIDKRVEQFDTKSGAFVQSIPFDDRYFSTSPRRSCRIITKIAINRGKILLGTECASAEFDIESGTFARSRSESTIPDTKELVIGRKSYLLIEDSTQFSIEPAEDIQ